MAVLISVFVALLAAMLLPLWAKLSEAEQEKARERRMVEHRMNARLNRLDI
jgi:hypothetical protein